MTEIITGVGFGVGGPEESYLLLVGEDGSRQIIQAGKLVPAASRCDWMHIESLMDGYDPPLSVEESAGFGPMPRACRVRITVEAEPLSEAETTEVLERVKAWRARQRQEP